MIVDRLLSPLPRLIRKLERHHERMSREAAYHAGAAEEAKGEAIRADSYAKKLTGILEICNARDDD